MEKTGCRILFLWFILMALNCAICNAQTIDELRLAKKQLEERNSALEAQIKRLQRTKTKNEAETADTIQSLQIEIKRLRLKMDSITVSERSRIEAENKLKTIKLEIKDPVFYAYLLRFCDMDNDGALTKWDAEHTYVIDISRDKSLLNLIGSSNQITNIAGIEHFVNLKRLVCSGNSIPQIDLSKNVQLETFIANGCEIKILDVSKNDKLVCLECNNNVLYTIDLKSNPILQFLDVSRNKMAAIDISGCPRLKRLNCSGNALINLDVSNNIELQTIDCSNNKLTTLSFAKNIVLDNINCSNNKLTDLDVRNGIDIKFIDCSKNKDLEFVYFGKGCRVLSDKRDPKTYFK